MEHHGRDPAPALKYIKQDRKKDILLSAEKLFALRSYDGVSIRDIAEDADVPSRLVGYYFGKKDDLFEAIFEHRKPNIDERLSLLERAKVQFDAPDALENMVAAWCAPVIQMRAHPDGENFLILVARTVWEQSEIAVRVIRRFYDHLAKHFVDTLNLVCPELDEATRYWIYEWALGALLMHIADRRVERLSNGLCRPGDADRTQDLITFLCAGIRAMRAARAGQHVQVGSRSARRRNASASERPATKKTSSNKAKGDSGTKKPAAARKKSI